ncbi:MAG: DUF2256 domain-containing protein [Actinobacteria bacterium]|nr:DUF2256 domain-containing protein [Actinomycetota bacterium]
MHVLHEPNQTNHRPRRSEVRDEYCICHALTVPFGFVPRIAQTKNGHPPKTCVTCGRPFEWRKKWERDWDTVLHCSDACRAKRPRRTSAD